MFDVINGSEVLSGGYVIYRSYNLSNKSMYHDSAFRSRSFLNVEECSLLLQLVKLLIWNGVSPGNIGVITPYKAQEKRIRAKLKDLGE